MTTELSNLRTETLEKFHTVLLEVNEELQGDKSFHEAWVTSEAFQYLTLLEQTVFKAVKNKAKK